MGNYLLIVGDKFKEFADNNDSVMTKTNYLDQITNENVQSLSRYDILIGQGVAPEEIQQIKKSIVEGRKIQVLTNLGLSEVEENEHQRTVHKHNKENIMISPPSRVGQYSYLSSLHLRDGCSELSDHMTGQHIQGMSLIEAARQLMLSVSEEFLLDNQMRFNSYFVLNNIESEFNKFIFPLEVSMLFRLKNIENKKLGSISAESECEFMQNGEHVATVRITFSTYAQDFISGRESELASICCQQLFRNKDMMSEQSYAS